MLSINSGLYFVKLTAAVVKIVSYLTVEMQMTWVIFFTSAVSDKNSCDKLHSYIDTCRCIIASFEYDAVLQFQVHIGTAQFEKWSRDRGHVQFTERSTISSALLCCV